MRNSTFMISAGSALLILGGAAQWTEHPELLDNVSITGLMTVAVGLLERLREKKEPAMTQQQIDKIVRAAKGVRAVEELLRDTPSYQIYLLSDGSWLRVDKNIGIVDFKANGKGRWRRS